MESNKIDTLITKKKMIDKAKQDKLRIEGEVAGIVRRLFKEFGCSSLEEAKEKKDEMLEIIEEKEIELREMIQNIEDSYDW